MLPLKLKKKVITYNIGLAKSWALLCINFITMFSDIQTP